MTVRPTSRWTTLLLLVAACLPTVILVIVLCVGAAEVHHVVIWTPIQHRRHR